MNEESRKNQLRMIGTRFPTASDVFSAKSQENERTYLWKDGEEHSELHASKGTNLFAFERELLHLATLTQVRLPMKNRPHGLGSYVDDSKPLGRLRKITLTALSSYLSGYVYSPHIDAAYALAHDPKHQFLVGGAMTNNTMDLGLNNKDSVSKVESYFTDLRDEFNSKAFKQKLKNRRDNAKDALGSMRYAANSILEDNAVVACIRLDVNAHANYFDEHGRLQVSNFTGVYLVENLRREKARFIKNISNNKLFDRLLMGIAKFEYAELRGPHVHFTFIFKINKNESVAYIAQQIGERWVEQLDGKGSYHNCAKDLNKFKTFCIGTIHRNDLRAAKGLEKALAYLAKEDQYFRVNGIEGAKSFTIFGLPDVKRKSSGRQRQGTKVFSDSSEVNQEPTVPFQRLKFPKIPKYPQNYSAKVVRTAMRAHAALDDGEDSEKFANFAEMRQSEEKFVHERSEWLVQEAALREAHCRKNRKPRPKSDLLRDLNGTLKPVGPAAADVEVAPVTEANDHVDVREPAPEKHLDSEAVCVADRPRRMPEKKFKTVEVQVNKNRVKREKIIIL